MIDAATRFSRSDASKIRDLAEANQLGRKCSEASIKNNIRRFRRIMSTLTDGKSFGGQMRPSYLHLNIRCKGRICYMIHATISRSVRLIIWLHVWCEIGVKNSRKHSCSLNK